MTARTPLRSAVFGAISAVLILGAGPALAKEARCGAAASEHLSALGIAAADVEGVSVIRVLNSQEFGTLRELQAWTTLRSCDGNVVTKLTTTCRVKETYTRGGCRVDGLPHFFRGCRPQRPL